MRALVAAMLMLVVAQGAQAAEDANNKIAERIKSVDSRLDVESVTATPMDGLFEVVLSSGEVLYTDSEGEYVLSGELFHLEQGRGLVNLTEQRMQKVRVDALAKIPAEQRVVFPAKGERKARIQVFTDVDCVYCRRLHSEVETLNEMGIEVDYLAFPRGGERSAAAGKMSAIWCAEPGEERRELMNRAKAGEALEPVNCENPVLDQFHLGQQLGVNGTPALILDNGQMLPGYVPAERLKQILEI
ncbi:DsbC family protein [Marinobacterium lutimaris]|uniref:Thiol:disulfide interchange protein n=1 Tax=Marinobacterium lutimaris TaxID=568106 RepID=A0A1H6D5N6_9GAMM|nr:DsbC family protein [Marinobacterium lutimaris]SEG80689.1 Thiol:disulfide interchange protein DsbC [Marinobacterium lutimaris]